jgi:ribosomal protein S18 acetylase RimI-like enzyme
MTNKPNHHNQFVVRELRDQTELSQCLNLDHSYVTDYVWQMDVREESDDLHVRFRTVRLPRTMTVAYPRDSHTLKMIWKELHCFLVATTRNIMLGYINMQVDGTGTRGWIYDLVVDTSFRRRKVASAMLEQATRWARLHHVQQLTLEMQTKNYPAIQFARTHGFMFCGFNDHYYSNQDIALFFDKRL